MKKKEAIRNTHQKHYRIWWWMKSVCYNRNAPGYKSYGYRGIGICQEWRNTQSSLLKFIEDVGEVPDDATGIELINPHADFSKLNFKWVNPANRGRKYDRSKKKLQDSSRLTSVTIRLRADHKAFLQKQAACEVAKKGKIISFNSMLRDCIETHLPHPKTIDMLGNKR